MEWIGKNKIILCLGIVYFLYAIPQAIGLYHLYVLVEALLESATSIVTRYAGALFVQTSLMIVLLWGLYRHKRWSRYALYFFTVLLIASAVSFLPMTFETMYHFSIWFQISFIALFFYYGMMVIVSCLYLFHPAWKAQGGQTYEE